MLNVPSLAPAEREWSERVSGALSAIKDVSWRMVETATLLLASVGGGQMAAAQPTPLEEIPVHPTMDFEMPVPKAPEGPKLKKEEPFSPSDIMTRIRQLGSSDFRARDASQKELQKRFNHDIMVLLAPLRYSSDLEVKRRVLEILPDDKLVDRINEFHPLPEYLKDHYLWLDTAEDRENFQIVVLSGVEKGKKLNLIEARAYYRWQNIYSDFHDKEWLDNYGDERRAHWYTCRQKHDAKGISLLQRSDPDLQHEWENAKTRQHFPTWKIDRFREGMKQSGVDVEAYALPFVKSSKAWSVQRNYAPKRPPVYPPGIVPEIEKK
ncbi:hypothetical protein EXS70_02250 [Candidatus Peribacteria bacterium]|nr:hypothetical protein [Candidatus Peribacteria bacterium]